MRALWKDRDEFNDSDNYTDFMNNNELAGRRSKFVLLSAWERRVEFSICELFLAWNFNLFAITQIILQISSLLSPLRIILSSKSWFDFNYCLSIKKNGINIRLIFFYCRPGRWMFTQVNKVQVTFNLRPLNHFNFDI